MSKFLIVAIVTLLIVVGNVATYLGNAHLSCRVATPDGSLRDFLSEKPPLTGNGHGYQ